MDRRDFVKLSLKLSALGLLVPPALRSRSLFGPGAALAGGGATAPFNGRILVWVNLGGGNDGLNTVVPYADPNYYAGRPTIAIQPGDVVPLDGATGFHPAMAALAPLYQAGKLAVVQGVGYPNMNLSHFRGTDIWFSGSAEDVYWNTGWLARFLEAVFPDYPYLLPDSPYGLQQSFYHRLPLTGDRGLTGIIVDNPTSFFDLVNSTYPGSYDDTPPATRGGEELSYLRALDLQTYEYAEAIQLAATAGQNTVVYPNTFLGAQLSVIARLISGGLQTPVYLGEEQGFDTHASQSPAHAALVGSVADATAAFWQDMANLGYQQKVLVMTTSEFGRRVEENGSFGTDHGTSAPHFVLGDEVAGGLYGTNPDLTNLDLYGNLQIQHDYRTVLGTVLRGHFGASDALISDLFAGDHGFLPFLQPATDVSDDVPGMADRLEIPEPNPCSLRRDGAATLRFSLATAGSVALEVYDLRGRRIAEVARGHHEAGAHTLHFEPRELPAGVYIVRLRTERFRKNAKLVLLP